MNKNCGIFIGRRTDNEKWCKGYYLCLHNQRPDGADLHIIVDENGEYNRCDPDSISFIPMKILSKGEYEQLGEFYIIENDSDREYGLSYVWWNEDKTYINMYQNRLCIIDKCFSDCEDDLNVFSKIYGGETGDTALDAIDCHNNFWMDKHLDRSNIKIPVLYFDNDNEITGFLRCGFKEDRILAFIKEETYESTKR